MGEILGNLFLIAGAVGLFSFLSIASWAEARRREREAFYRSEAIKKVAEMPGPIPDSVLQLVRDTLPHEQTPASTKMAVWAPGAYRRERDMYYRNEMLNKIAAMPGATAETALEYIRSEEKKVEERRRDGLRLGGMITSAAGVAFMFFLYYVIPNKAVYLVGLVPTFVGIALIAFAEIGRKRD